MVSDIGVSIAPDLATYSKSRGNVAKVKVEIDLLKSRVDQIWLTNRWNPKWKMARY